MERDATLRSRARGAYELGLLLRALIVYSSTLALSFLAIAVGGPTGWTVGFGAALFGVTTFFVWRGRDFAQGVRAGLVAGLLPFVAIATVHFGIPHGCMGAHCYSTCLPTCIAAGTVSGAAVGVVVSRKAHPWWAGLAAVAATALSGALGCGYLGLHGLVALSGGVVATAAIVAVVLRAQTRRRTVAP